jgi:hypothetical protein
MLEEVAQVAHGHAGSALFPHVDYLGTYLQLYGKLGLGVGSPEQSHLLCFQGVLCTKRVTSGCSHLLHLLYQSIIFSVSSRFLTLFFSPVKHSFRSPLLIPGVLRSPPSRGVGGSADFSYSYEWKYS